MKKTIDKAISAIVLASDAIAVIFLVICTVTAFVNTVMRYVFKMPINFSEELCVISLIWLVFASLLLLERNNEHLNMTALYNVLPKKVQTVLNVIRSFLTIGLAAWLCSAGFTVVNRNFSLNTNTQVLDWPYGFVYLIIPVAFALVLIIRLADIPIKNSADNADVADGGSGKC